VAVINVTLMATGCPRPEVHEAALQLLQVLDKRFFGAVLPLATEGEYPQKLIASFAPFLMLVVNCQKSPGFEAVNMLFVCVL
jgi:hypothetical protein